MTLMIPPNSSASAAWLCAAILGLVGAPRLVLAQEAVAPASAPAQQNPAAAPPGPAPSGTASSEAAPTETSPPPPSAPVPPTDSASPASQPAPRAAPPAPPTSAPSDTAPSSGAAPSPSEAPATSSAELAEIEAALAADTEATADGSSTNSEAGAPTGAASGAPPQSLNPDISAVFDAAVAYFSDDDNLQTGHHDPTANGFNFQQLEVSLVAPASPYLRLDAHILFGPEEVEVEEVYGTTLGLPWALQARFGQMLSRFGRVNPTHPHQWQFVDQPFALGRVFGGDGGRGLGIELSWLSPLPWYVELVGSATNADGEGARSFQGDDGDGVHDLSDLLYVAALKQFFPLGDDWSLSWGLSTALGPNPSFEHARTDVFGTDLYLKFRPISVASTTELSLQTEWLLRRRQVPQGELEDASGYAQVFFRFAQRWGTAARYEFGSPERADGETPASALDPEWTRARHRVATNLSFWPTEFSRFRLQTSIDVPRWREEPILAVFLNAEVSIGAHGAHTF